MCMKFLMPLPCLSENSFSCCSGFLSLRSFSTLMAHHHPSHPESAGSAPLSVISISIETESNHMLTACWSWAAWPVLDSCPRGLNEEQGPRIAVHSPCILVFRLYAHIQHSSEDAASAWHSLRERVCAFASCLEIMVSHCSKLEQCHKWHMPNIFVGKGIS